METTKQNTLEVFSNQHIIFQSDKKWLYPVFDLEDFLRVNPYDHSTLHVHDKVVGKAAALLMMRLGVGSVHGEVMSQLADVILNKAAMKHTYGILVERIDCQTEEILLNIDDADAAYGILCKRAKRC